MYKKPEYVSLLTSVVILIHITLSVIIYILQKYNTESKGQYSQVHRMRTAAGTFRATSLELLRALAVAGGSGGISFVRCVRATLSEEAYAFQPDVVRQQLRALAVLDTAKARQLGYSTRIPFAEFLKRYYLKIVTQSYD